ncbi:hypothetical protein J7J83_00645 [bacterium]|nr:hypothetical protein [bacterium]
MLKSHIKKSKDVKPSAGLEQQQQREFKRQHILDETKHQREKLRVDILKGLSAGKAKEAMSYTRKFKSEEIMGMLDKSAKMSVYDLRRGGTLRLRYEKEKDPKKKMALKKQLHENQGYAQMTAQFAKEKKTKSGRKYLEVDLKGVDRYEQQLGAGHICPYTWVKVAIEDINGSIQTGYRKIPGVDKGIFGTKIGYYTESGEYLPVYSGYKIYPLEIKDDPTQLQKEGEFYKNGSRENLLYRKNRDVGSRVSTAESYNLAKEQLAGFDKSKLAEKGITPFVVKIGYKLDPEETTVYRREYKEARRLSKMDIHRRMEIMQQRYHLKDALDLAFKALHIAERHRNYYYAYNDAVMYVESRYNPIAVNKRKGKIALSTATGAFQILNSVWKEGASKWLRNTSRSARYRDSYNRNVPPKYRIDFGMLDGIDFNQSLPGLATPYQHAIFHNLYAFRGSRMYKGSMPFDEVFDRLQAGDLSPKMKYSYQSYLYANWRNGHSGAKFIMQMIRRGIPFPQSKDEARDYFENKMPNCWQKRRGFSDFWGLVRTCKAFTRRLNKGLREQA